MSLGIGCRAAEQQLYNVNPHVAQATSMMSLQLCRLEYQAKLRLYPDGLQNNDTPAQLRCRPEGKAEGLTRRP